MFKPSARYCAEVKAMIIVMIIPKKKTQTNKQTRCGHESRF